MSMVRSCIKGMSIYRRIQGVPYKVTKLNLRIFFSEINTASTFHTHVPLQRYEHCDVRTLLLSNTVKYKIYCIVPNKKMLYVR
jgi:hypothetical protein